MSRLPLSQRLSGVKIPGPGFEVIHAKRFNASRTICGVVIPQTAKRAAMHEDSRWCWRCRKQLARPRCQRYGCHSLAKPLLSQERLFCSFKCATYAALKLCGKRTWDSWRQRWR